jgi:signal transduction histidine kinase/CheY-like chemotaxis protein
MNRRHFGALVQHSGYKFPGIRVNMMPSNRPGPAMAAPVPLEEVITTEALQRRPSREPDHAAESAALVALMQALKESRPNLLQEVAEAATRLCRADSAGISLAEVDDGEDVFRWHASVGRWAPYLRQTMSRHASPCGVVLDRGEPLMMALPERHFAYDSVTDTPPIREALLVPFADEGVIVGTLWVIAHDRDTHFDAEDLRLLQSLSAFASVAFHVRKQHEKLGEALDREVAGTLLLHSLSVGLIREGDVDALFQKIIEAAKLIMRSQFASLQRLEPNGDLTLLAWSGFHPESARHWQHIPTNSVTSCAETSRARSRYAIADAEEAPELRGSQDLEEFRRSGIRSMQSTPLISRSGKQVGVVSTHWNFVHEPGENELRLFDVLARQAADLVERTNTEAALREADRRKDEFLAVLGHELRNPLAPLSTGIELLERGRSEQTIIDGVHAMMRRQVTHLTRLVDDLLDLSRITRGEIELRRQTLDLRVVTEAATELVRPLIDQRGHRLLISHTDNPLWVEGDMDRITQVVGNLLSNAAKYMSPGGTIALRTEIVGDDVVLRVTDRGFGIPFERLPEIFEMFMQVPEHRARRGGGGLGVGLALSRQLVELHGGTLTATSDGADQGSEFVMRLPRAEVDAEVRPPAPVPARVEVESRRILIVDDNVDAAQTLRDVLQLSGHTVAVAHDGPASLDLFEAFDPQVCLLDIGLPMMDGYELARRIRAKANGHGIRLVAITGWGQDTDRERSRDAGFDLHLTKPVDLDALEAALAE